MTWHRHTNGGSQPCIGGSPKPGHHSAARSMRSAERGSPTFAPPSPNDGCGSNWYGHRSLSGALASLTPWQPRIAGAVDGALMPFLSRAEVDALRAVPDQRTRSGRRDHALSLPAVHTGFRLPELTSLRPEDLQVRTGAHVRVIGKGRKERCTPLSKNTRARPRRVGARATAGGRPAGPRVERVDRDNPGLLGRRPGVEAQDHRQADSPPTGKPGRPGDELLAFLNGLSRHLPGAHSCASSGRDPRAGVEHPLTGVAVRVADEPTFDPQSALDGFGRR